MELTPRASRVLALAEDRARELGHGRVGVEHLLLALCEDGGGVAGRVLREFDPTSQLRVRLLEIFEEPGYSTGTRRVTDSDGRFLGEFVTDEEGNDIFLGPDGLPRPWPQPS